MYIVVSIVAISFVEILGMIFFRSWEIKKGNRLHEINDNTFSVFHLIHRTGHSIFDKGVDHGKNMIPKLYKKMYAGLKVIHSRVGTDKIYNIVKGKNSVNNANNNTPSLYLKDMTEHKNGVRERIENGKEKIRVD